MLRRLIPRKLAIYQTPAPAESGWTIRHKFEVSPELGGLLQAWSKLRDQTSTYLSKSEFRKVAPTIPQHHVEALFQLFARKNNGAVSYNELCTYLIMRSTSLTPEEKVEFIFPLCDINGDNQVTPAELKQIAATLAFAHTEDTAAADTFAQKVSDEAFKFALADGSLDMKAFINWARSNGVMAKQFETLVNNPF
jgi:Ca2+-binding EF-hand superfamily protein